MQDQIREFHDVTASEVRELEASVRNAEAQMERMQETHRSALKVRGSL